MTPPNRLLIIGDSIALGITSITIDDVRTITQQSYVQQLRELLPAWQIEVDAAARRTTSQATQVLPAHLEQFRPDVVLIFLGGNDVDINWKQFILTDGRRIRHNTLLEKFEANLRQLANAARQAGAIVVFSSLPAQNLMERGRQLSTATGRDVVALIEAVGGEHEDEQRHRLFADVIERVAGETGAFVVRWTGRVAALPLDKRFGSDGAHPGDAAHAIIAETLADLLPQLKRCDDSTTLATVRA